MLHTFDGLWYLCFQIMHSPHLATSNLWSLKLNKLYVWLKGKLHGLPLSSHCVILLTFFKDFFYWGRPPNNISCNITVIVLVFVTLIALWHWYVSLFYHLQSKTYIQLPSFRNACLYFEKKTLILTILDFCHT